MDNLLFGIDNGHATAWGARAILTRKGTIDLLHDRQDGRGGKAYKRLAKALNDGVLAEVRQAIKRECFMLSENRLVELFRGKGVVVVGNPQGSHGYLYLGAWFESDEESKTNLA